MSGPGTDQQGVDRQGAADWCLFLDRDGVINRRVVGGYVRTWADFEFLPGALDALARLSTWAPHVVVVTNQQGIGKAVMSHADVADVHDRMAAAVAAAGGRIDGVRVCPHLASQACRCRKPQTGLALDWLASHPDVDPARCVMVGDSAGDLELGRDLQMRTCVWIRGGPDLPPPHTYDAAFASLDDFSAAVAVDLLEGAPA